METSKYNEQVFKIFADTLNKKGRKAIFAIGMKSGELPSLLVGGDIPKETIIEFLRATADNLENNSIDFDRVGSFDQSNSN